MLCRQEDHHRPADRRLLHHHRCGRRQHQDCAAPISFAVPTTSPGMRLDQAIADFNELTRSTLEHAGFVNRGEPAPQGRTRPCHRRSRPRHRYQANQCVRWSNRGITESDKGDPDRAIADYNQAIRLNSRDAWYFNNRGNSYGDKRRFRACIGRLQSGDRAQSEIRPRLLQPQQSLARQGQPTPLFDD